MPRHTNNLDTVVQTLVGKAAFADAVVDLVKEHGLIKPLKRRQRRAQAEPEPKPKTVRRHKPKPHYIDPTVED